MVNSLTTAITKLADKLGLKTDTDFADKDSKIDHYQSSQVKVIDLIKQFCEYTNHIFYIENSTLYLVDKLTLLNRDSSSVIDEFMIKSNSLKITNNSIIKEFRVTYNQLKINSVEKFEDEELEIIHSVLKAGDTVDVTAYSKTKSDILYELDKRRELYMLENISFELTTPDYRANFLDTIEFQTATFSGKMVISEVTKDKKTEIVTVKGYGNANYN